MGGMGQSVRVRAPRSRLVPCSRVRLAALLGSLAALVLAASRAQAGPGASRECFAMAGLDPVDRVEGGRHAPAGARASARSARAGEEPGPGGTGARRAEPITKEEVPLLLRDLERVPLESGGYTIRAARGEGLPPERLRQLVGDVRAALVVQHGREVLALLRKTPGVRPAELKKLEQNVHDSARCAFERLGDERAYKRVIDILGELRPQVEAVVLEPMEAGR